MRENIQSEPKFETMKDTEGQNEKKICHSCAVRVHIKEEQRNWAEGESEGVPHVTRFLSC